MEVNNFVKQAFEAARRANLCYNKREFGDLLGVNRSTISRAINGEPSDILILKVKNFLSENGVVIGGDNNGTAIGEQHAAPQDPQLSTADRLLQEMQAQREMYDRQFSELLRQNSQLIQIITKGV